MTLVQLNRKEQLFAELAAVGCPTMAAIRISRVAGKGPVNADVEREAKARVAAIGERQAEIEAGIKPEERPAALGALLCRLDWRKGFWSGTAACDALEEIMAAMRAKEAEGMQWLQVCGRRMEWTPARIFHAVDGHDQVRPVAELTSEDLLFVEELELYFPDRVTRYVQGAFVDGPPDPKGVTAGFHVKLLTLETLIEAVSILADEAAALRQTVQSWRVEQRRLREQDGQQGQNRRAS